ncbi:thiamine-monophosphate kinase [Ferrigenium kumadai]|uniref:Thiamine-monophosphate kinase n=1 Tax=Ferrigenium kumadai TaxID=1682490 RepID=A0AAN1T0W8_9PROT|nr:thiamine-phosphate kinase [Ferrigenium kumadai]BBJ00217.1 thiamine-monophosphate kinase [Ferrigenium kumadai]
MSEFDLIRRFFTRATPGAVLGVGDDAALLQVSPGNVLAVSTDMLVCGTHFFPDADPFLLGHKTLAVNLSDLAAMGAVPRWATLAIAIPSEEEAWLERFSAGFFALAQQHGVDLVGGDTTRGPLNLCVTIFGEVPAQQALRRDGAKAGDDIWVSGELGDAALALAHLLGRIKLGEAELAACAARLHQPHPRVALGLALRGIASSAIDVSDGLLADLGHILERSNVGAEIEFDALPVSPWLRGRFQQKLALCGGDDYELCFTAPAARRAEVKRIAAQLGLPLTRIGEIVAGRGCIVHDTHGHPIDIEVEGYDHFR